MNLDLTGKTALVTGSTAGIGFAIASGLAAEGAAVWINGRTQSRVDAGISAIRKVRSGTRIQGVAANVATAEGARTIIAALPDVDILVNNAGGVVGVKPFEALDDSDWSGTFELNVMSGVRLTRHYLPAMRRRNWGRVIFISSESGVQIPVEFPHYGVAKAGEIALARGIAESLVGTGVTVNSVLPGPTSSEVLDRMKAASGRTEAEITEDFFSKRRPTSLLRRFTTPEEVANLAVYLCSPAASATHGAALRVDGGVIKAPV